MTFIWGIFVWLTFFRIIEVWNVTLSNHSFGIHKNSSKPHFPQHFPQMDIWSKINKAFQTVRSTVSSWRWLLEVVKNFYHFNKKSSAWKIIHNFHEMMAISSLTSWKTTGGANLFSPTKIGFTFSVIHCWFKWIIPGRNLFYPTTGCWR